MARDTPLQLVRRLAQEVTVPKGPVYVYPTVQRTLKFPAIIYYSIGQQGLSTFGYVAARSSVVRIEFRDQERSIDTNQKDGDSVGPLETLAAMEAALLGKLRASGRLRAILSEIEDFEQTIDVFRHINSLSILK